MSVAYLVTNRKTQFIETGVQLGVRYIWQGKGKENFHDLTGNIWLLLSSVHKLNWILCSAQFLNWNVIRTVRVKCFILYLKCPLLLLLSLTWKSAPLLPSSPSKLLFHFHRTATIWSRAASLISQDDWAEKWFTSRHLRWFALFTDVMCSVLWDPHCLLDNYVLR